MKTSVLPVPYLPGFLLSPSTAPDLQAGGGRIAESTPGRVSWVCSGGSKIGLGCRADFLCPGAFAGNP